MPEVIVTRPVEQAGRLVAALRDVGVAAVVIPTIEIRLETAGGPLDAAAGRLAGFDWVVVTSPNGARAAIAAADRAGTTGARSPRWAAVGSATRAALESGGVAVAFEPGDSRASVLGHGLPIERDDRILLVRGDLADPELVTMLAARGAHVTDIVGYRTIEAPSASADLLRETLAGHLPAAVLFASGSAARGFVGLAIADGFDPFSLPAVAIGPETAREAEALGFRVLATSPTADAWAFAATTAGAIGVVDSVDIERPAHGRRADPTEVATR
jgi:uroporphyrinogen-III synthase